jgi:hypothetical protein
MVAVAVRDGKSGGGPKEDRNRHADWWRETCFFAAIEMSKNVPSLSPSAAELLICRA